MILGFNTSQLIHTSSQKARRDYHSHICGPTSQNVDYVGFKTAQKYSFFASFPDAQFIVPDEPALGLFHAASPDPLMGHI